MVLLDYLIKNGSERVVDDARSHVTMIKIMRNFYYIDEKGKDEGLNGMRVDIANHRYKLILVAKFETGPRKLWNF